MLTQDGSSYINIELQLLLDDGGGDVIRIKYGATYSSVFRLRGLRVLYQLYEGPVQEITSKVFSLYLFHNFQSRGRRRGGGAGEELMEKEKVQVWNGASRRGTNGRGEGTSLEWS
jgi:hypothetical protein